MDDMHEYLAAAGVTVASLEQRGFGASTGQANLAKWPEDMAAVGEWLRARSLRVWVTGLSTGGTLALTTAAKYDWFVGAIALSPFANLGMILEDYPPCRDILVQAFGELRRGDFVIADALRWTPRIAPRPAILIHSRRDQVVPFAHARLISDKTGAALWPISGGNHRLEKIDRPKLFERIKQAIFTF
jgi:alpha-beta hydrolase superfamily lysophospholipase